MKRKLEATKNVENHKTTERNRKKRKLNGYKKSPLSLCSSVHRMELYYASMELTQTKYSECPKCHTLNDYESMHFIYDCSKCSFYCCNFCMADEYNAGKAIHMTTFPIAALDDTRNTSRYEDEPSKQSRKKGKQYVGVGAKLLIADGAVDSDGNELHSHELHTVKRIDEEGFAITEYGEVDLQNNEYYIVDPKCKVHNKGELVGSRSPDGEPKWAQYYIGTIISKRKNNDIVRYKVRFNDGECFVTNVMRVKKNSI